MKKIDGKAIAAKKLLALKEEVADLGVTPALGVILVGDDAPSHLYVKLKEKAAKDVGVELRTYVFGAQATQEELHKSIAFLNTDPDTHGIIVQLPLPDHCDTDDVIGCIDPKKDVDGFHSENQKKFLQGDALLYPVFPHAIVALIDSCNVVLPEKNAVIIGKSDVFDRVMSHALQEKGMHVTFIQYSQHRTLSQHEKDCIYQSDVIVTACGMPGVISCENIRDGAIVIDGGISKIDGKTVGDVDVTGCDDRDIFLSPVPGGVGPMTIACLLENVVAVAEKTHAEDVCV